MTTHTEQGDPDAAEAALRAFAPGEPTRTQTGAVLLLARGHLRVAQRRLEAGLADIQAAGDVALRTGAVSPAYLLWRSAAALAQLALGEPEAALALAREELELGRVFGAPRVLGAALRTAGVVTGGPEGEELLREAVATLEGAGVALESARALVDLGSLLRRSNRRAEARELLREGLDIAHRGGRGARRRPGGDRAARHRRPAAARALTGLDALTASERRVAELAAQGMTNREIAQALFVTARTVEGHLTQTFQKLDLRSREDLGWRWPRGERTTARLRLPRLRVDHRRGCPAPRPHYSASCARRTTSAWARPPARGLGGASSRARARPTGWRSRSARTARWAAASASTSRTRRSSRSRATPTRRSRAGACAPRARPRASCTSTRRASTRSSTAAPHGTEWEELDLDTAMDMIADRLIAARDAGWEDVDEHGHRLNRTLGFAHLGGATLDNEENYLIKKFFSAMGALQIENQARI